MDLKELYQTDRKKFFELIGSKGGRANVKKGFAKMPKKRLREIGAKGGRSRTANA